MMPPKRPFADSMPMPVAVERDTDSAWVQFQDLSSRQDARFAATVPQALVRAAPENAAQAPQRARAITLDEVLLEARRGNRVCPVPVLWHEFFDLLPDKTPGQPTAPLDARAWRETSSLAKRMVFREQLEWAEARGALGAAMDFIRKMREEDWHHMGD